MKKNKWVLLLIYLYQISAIQLTIRRLRKLRLVELKLQQAF